MADNLSSSEILTELDGIVRVDRTGEERRVAYLETAPVSAWYMRSFLLFPLRGALGFVFGVRHEETIENPTAHVRTLLRELPDETGGDLSVCAAAASRLGWIADFETNTESRVVALDGLCRLSAQLRLTLFVGPLAKVLGPADPARLATARLGLQVGRPGARGEEPWDEVRLAPYLSALIDIVQDPLESAIARLTLVEDLTALYDAERDARVRPAAAAALRQAIVHLSQGILLGIVQDRDPRFVDLRLCALEQTRRLGGPRVVPLLLAVMAATPEQLSRNAPRFDRDPLIQLRLIHYCGQLSGELLHAVVELPGRVGWATLSPADFLVNTILTEQAYYSKLRTPAMVALTWSLRRSLLDPDPTWVREWRDSRRP